MNTGLSRAMQSVFEAIDTNADASAVWCADSCDPCQLHCRRLHQIQLWPKTSRSATEERHIAVYVQRGIRYEEFLIRGAVHPRHDRLVTGDVIPETRRRHRD